MRLRTPLVFRAVSDTTRRAILDQLAMRPLTVNQIAQAFPVSRPAISRHLRLLRHAKLVAERRAGRQRIYRLNASPLKAIDDWVSRYQLFWRGTLIDLKEFVERQERGAAADSSGDRT